MIAPAQAVNPAPGRIVHFVLEKGQVRPLIVVRVWVNPPRPGYLTGVLFRDGTADSAELGVPPKENVCTQLVTAYYDEAKTPGTWHWPESTP